MIEENIEGEKKGDSSRAFKTVWGERVGPAKNVPAGLLRFAIILKLFG